MDGIDWGHLLFQFDGRINRAKFWAGIVVIWVAAVAISIVWSVAGDAGGVIAGLLSLALIWPGLAVYTKRWHDRGKSGWWTFIVFIPIIGSLWLLIELGFLTGDDGPNEYGPDPLAAGE